jgi:phenylpropionate dioxygenase-like ring-hydroxylating dioxygenase large terminal subunit
VLSAADNELLTRTNAGTPMGELLRRFWVPCLTAEELAQPDGEPVRITIMGEDLLAFRDTSGRAAIVDAYCAHRGAPLFYGRNEECGLRCIYHGWKYDADGNCVDMPNEPPYSRFKERIKLKAYPVREAGGLIWAYMGPADKVPDMPGLEWLSAPADHTYIEKYLVESNFAQAVEGDHDSSHASALHSSLANKFTDEFVNGQTQFSGYHMTDKAPKLFVLDTDYGILTGARRNATPQTYLWRLVAWMKPFYSLIAAEPGRPFLINVRVPIDDENSWFFRVSFHPTQTIATERDAYQHSSSLYSEKIGGTFRSTENMDNDYLIDRAAQRTRTYSGIKSVPAQDRAVTERARSLPGRPGTQNRGEEHLGSADAAIIQIRKSLLRSARELQAGHEPALARTPGAYRLRAPALELPRDVPFEEGARPYLHGETWERQTPFVSQ